MGVRAEGPTPKSAIDALHDRYADGGGVRSKCLVSAPLAEKQTRRVGHDTQDSD